MFTYRLQMLIEKSDKSQNLICREMNISKQKLSKWKTGYNEPSISDIIMIARYFKVTIDYLVGYSDENENESL